MKRGFGYIISINLIISILVGGLVNLQSVNGYQPLTAGEQLLYKSTQMNWYSSDNMILAQFPNLNVTSYWDYYQSDSNYTTFNSFDVINAASTSVNVNHTFSEYEDYYHNSYQYQNYNYGLPGWEVYSSNDYSYDSDYTYSSHYPDRFFPANVTKGANIDLSHIYGPSYFNLATYQSSFTFNTVINGVPQAIPIDYFFYSEMSLNDYEDYFYDMSYTTYVNEYRYHSFYVDQVTGNLLYYSFAIDYYEDNDWSNSSIELGMDFQGHYYYSSYTVNEWRLYESNMDYSPIADADIPAMFFKSFNHDITNLTSVVSIPFYLEDNWPTVTAEVYIDGTYYDTAFWSTSGMKYYDIPEYDIPYDGPGNSHWIMFKIYDDYDINHNSTWETYLNDFRTKDPTWGPSWIQGPTDVSIITGDYYEDYWVYSDTNWTVEFYKHDGFVYNLFDWWQGYQNETISFWDYDLTPGTYDYLIYFYDNVGVAQDIYLTLTVNPADAPIISGQPPGVFWYEVGTSDKIYWQLFDNDPFQFEVKLNSILIVGPLPYVDGEIVRVELLDYIFTQGDYVLSISANDSTGYNSIVNLNIHAFLPTDTDMPIIEGPDHTTYIEEGDEITLWWIIEDDHPANYTIYKNGTLESFSGWTNSYLEIGIDLSTLGVGFWYFEIDVYDLANNHNYDYCEVVVELPTDPTDPTDPSNTITLDAPQVLYAVLGILSILALTYTIRKRR